ncbi:hypothetical protein [Demequina oxidasica]|uniref:hypothetical protein n=1 Tax=Demequina oxidasica TaxID=676199 RepID=UPI00128CD2AA|nr:hypothetical protein [Demequina oxidasica]
MSAAPLRQRPSARAGAPLPSPRQAPRRREHLRAVAAPEQVRSMVPFAWLCVAIVLGSMAAVLILNTTMASGAYERRDLKIEIASLHQERASLVTQLESNSSPQFLANEAADMGMVPAETLGFVSLKDAVVLESEGQ